MGVHKRSKKIFLNLVLKRERCQPWMFLCGSNKYDHDFGCRKISKDILCINQRQHTHTHTHTNLWYHWFFLSLAFYKLSIEFRLNFIDTSMTLLWCLKEFNPNRIPVFTCILIILSIIHIGCGPCNLRGLIQWHLPNETSQHSMSRLHISSPKSLFGFIKTFLEIFIDFSSSSLVTHR